MLSRLIRKCPEERRTAFSRRNKYSPCPAETGERLSCASPSRPHCNYRRTKTKQNQQRVRNRGLRRCSFRRRRFWPTRKLNRNLDLRACAGLETPLRIRFKCGTIKLLVSGALQHSRSGNLAGLLINRDQHDPFPCEPLFRPFRSVNRFRRVDRLRRLLSRRRTSALRVQRINRDKREQKNESEGRNILPSRTSSDVANQARCGRAHLRIRHSIDASIEQIMNPAANPSATSAGTQIDVRSCVANAPNIRSP